MDPVRSRDRFLGFKINERIVDDRDLLLNGMEKEREYEFESGFSEKALDKAVDQARDLNQVKAGNIFDPKKKIVKEKIILDSTPQ